jgi:hypothetical protein
MNRAGRDNSAALPANLQLPFQLRPLGELFSRWDHDDVDRPGAYLESLPHFDATDPKQKALAERYRNADVFPFKLVGVPEVASASRKWSDEYVSTHLASAALGGGVVSSARESANHHFVSYDPLKWDLFEFGLAPIRTVHDWTFENWSAHARYADSAKLRPDQPHFGWEVDIPASTSDASNHQINFISQDVSNRSYMEREAFETLICVCKSISPLSLPSNASYLP